MARQIFRTLLAGVYFLVLTAFPLTVVAKQLGSTSYDDVLVLFADWREFETPPLLEAAPDYTAQTTARRHRELETYQARPFILQSGPNRVLPMSPVYTPWGLG